MTLLARDMSSMFNGNALLRVIAMLAIGAMPLAAQAWVYPEHRQLSLLAVDGLDGERRAIFDALWLHARGGERQLCAAGADREQGTAPACIDWAALSAIAGDHSCSSREMFETARGAPWIMQVADVAAQLNAVLLESDFATSNSDQKEQP